ncbi:hypothetical protein HY638_04715 [Candidatus Woesearchaeota archaeon]|nr:hypothetical protein [Candidatus Woesearchaeota archaeon]
MDNRQRILDLIRLKGPVIPIQVAKEIRTDTMIASAHLSELVASRHLKVSSVKHGSSPLYYIPGQEAMLQVFATNLNEKEKRTYDILKEHLVLQDSAQEPLVRYTLREIKDFAVPLQVNYDNKSELFWKWYLLPNEDAEKRIKAILGKVEPKKEEKQTVLEPKKEEIKKVEEKKKEIEERKPKAEKIERKVTEERVERKEERGKIGEKRDESFSSVLEGFISENKIEVVEKNVLKKDSEVEMVVRLPSSVGNLLYFCKVKNKKKISDGDLSSAYIQSQSRKMPILFLTNGELTKKAKEMLEQEFKSMTLKKI